jgi:hypothetical protein
MARLPPVVVVVVVVVVVDVDRDGNVDVDATIHENSVPSSSEKWSMNMPIAAERAAV